MSRNSLGIALLLLVACVHFGYDPVSQIFYPGIQAAPRAIFYIARGIEGVALYAAIAALASRNVWTWLACAWGALENAQTSVCRAVVGVDRASPLPEPYRGLCDIVTGVPVYGLTALAVLVAIAILQEADKSNGKG